MTYISGNSHICCNSRTIRGRVFILYMYIPCNETFLFIPEFWPVDFHCDLWPRCLKIFTFAIPFETLQVGHSYFICTFLVIRPFCSYQKFWPCNHDHDLSPTYLKTLTFTITFEPLEVWLSYLTTCTFLLMRHFCSYQNFWPVWLSWPLTYISVNLKKNEKSQIRQLVQDHNDCTPNS